MQKNCNQKQKYEKPNHAITTSNLSCPDQLINQKHQTSNICLQNKVILSRIRLVEQVTKKDSQKMKEVSKEKSQCILNTILNSKKKSEIQPFLQEDPQIYNFQDKLMFSKIQKSKSLPFTYFIDKIGKKIKEQPKHPFTQKENYKQNSQKKKKLDKNQLKKYHKNNYTALKKPMIQQIQDIIQKQKSRLKLPSFVRNLKYIQQNQAQNQLNQAKKIQVQKQMISLVHQRRPRLVSKISERFYRINNNHQQGQKQKSHCKTDKINRKKRHMHPITEPNQCLDQIQQHMMLPQNSKQYSLCFKNWQNKCCRIQKSKPALRKHTSKINLMKVLQNSIKIKCLKNINSISQKQIFQYQSKRINSKLKLNQIQKVPHIQVQKTQPQKQKTQQRYQLNTNQNQQTNSLQVYIADNVKDKLKLRLKELNETHSQTWQIS